MPKFFGNYNPKTWFPSIWRFLLHKQIMQRLLPGLIIVILYTFTVVMLIDKNLITIHFEDIAKIHALLGFVLSLFLVFRVNSAYDRWWEGRKQWGALVNNIRMLTIKVLHFVSDKTILLRLKPLIIAFPYLLRDHLRNQTFYVEEFPKDHPEATLLMQAEHKPNACVSILYQYLQQLKKANKISEFEFMLLDKELKMLIDILGACERIRNTPIPFSYATFIKVFLVFYVLITPLGFAREYHLHTLVIAILLYFFLFAIEFIAEEIENPFGTDMNDLPLTPLSQTMEKNVEELYSAHFAKKQLNVVV